MTVRTRHPGQERQDEIVETRQRGKMPETGHPEQDTQNTWDRTSRTGKLGEDRQFRPGLLY